MNPLESKAFGDGYINYFGNSNGGGFGDGLWHDCHFQYFEKCLGTTRTHGEGVVHRVTRGNGYYNYPISVTVF